MDLARERIKRNPNDSRAHYALSVSYGLRANYSFMVRKAFVDALRDASSSHAEQQRASQIEPGFIDARMVQGAYDYVIGSLPWSMKFLGFLAGFRGDKERGISTLRMVAQE